MTFQWFSAAAERKREEEEVKMLPKFVSFAERQSPIVLSLRVKHAVFRSFSGIPRRTLKAAKKGNSAELLLLPLARVAFTTERGCDGKLFPFTDFGYSINIHIESQRHLPLSDWGRSLAFTSFNAPVHGPLGPFEAINQTQSIYFPRIIALCCGF